VHHRADTLRVSSLGRRLVPMLSRIADNEEVGPMDSSSSRRITRIVRSHTRNSFSSKSAAGLPKRRVVRRNSSKSRG